MTATGPTTLPGTTVPVPIPTPVSEPFWAACRRQTLIVQRCGRCGACTFPPQMFCRSCLAESLEWVPVTGTGSVYSYTVIWRPQTAAFEAPYVVAIIELDEGYVMLSNVVGSPPEDVTVGARVHVVWDEVTADITLPKFALTRGR